MRNFPPRVVGYVTATGEAIAWPKPRTVKNGARVVRLLREHEVDVLIRDREKFAEGGWDEFDEAFGGLGLDKVGWR